MTLQKSWLQLLILVSVLLYGWVTWKTAYPGKQQARWNIYGFQTSRHTHVTEEPVVWPKSKECNNLLQNLTVGNWRTRQGANFSSFDRTHQMYWRKKGILKNLWRDDGKCGYKNLQEKIPGSRWPAVGSWCNNDGSKPCCNNIQDGTCSAPTKQACDCNSCVDMRKYVYAELSDWYPNDYRCSWTKFESAEGCDVIDKSPYHDIRFVGDSLMRNMFAGLMMLLSNDTKRGAWGKNMNEDQKALCVEEQFFFWDGCRAIISSTADLLYKERLCSGKKLNFTATTHVYFSMSEAREFHKLMLGLNGRIGTLVLVGVGMHMNMDAKAVITRYLGPAVQIRQDFYKDKNVSTISMWPKIFFMSPMLIGLLKPPGFMSQNDVSTAKYVATMHDYCNQHQIPFFDYRPLTKLVHSFDGSHFGLGVNLMKNQILLNYISQESLT